MRRLALRISSAIMLLLALPLAAQNDIPGAEVVHPYQRVTVPNLAVVAATDTSSPAVAKAALAIVLSGSKVKCGPDSQLESAVEANAGSPLRTLASEISGASCATNGRTLHVTATFTPNGAIQGDSLIASVIEGKPLLFEWKGALYVLYGVVYDEHLYPRGRHDNVIRRLLLIDPRYPDRRRLKAFVREKDNLAEIGGVASVSVTEQ
jgi:hypothetical protein